MAAPNNPLSLDFALAQHRSFWLQHPVIGSPSWDSFKRESGNPIYRGTPPYDWPVNGFLFHDPVSTAWYAYIGLYPKNYWPPGGCLLLKEQIPGKWVNLGIILQGDAHSFDGDGEKAGGTPDVSILYADGKYHMVYDWATPTNSAGGIAYAWAESPEGPFHRDPTPIHDDRNQPLLLGKYSRVYAATLFRRSTDWIILAMMSTKGNAGGSWALVALTAQNPAGPYSEPLLLLYPQSLRFHPGLAEFFPAFEFDAYVYAPATSVAKNRTFQTIFRAPKAQMLDPKAWEIFQYGSVWHDLGDQLTGNPPNHEQGIWGQTISCHVYSDVANQLRLRALSFSKTRENIGTANLSQAPWPWQFHDGFRLSAPYAHSAAILLPQYRTFLLQAEIYATGSWTLNWGSNSPLGPSHPGADCELHKLSFGNGYRARFLTDKIQIQKKSHFKQWKTISRIKYAPSSVHSFLISLNQLPNECFLQIDLAPTQKWRIPCQSRLGRIELIADVNSSLRINHFIVNGSIKTPEIVFLGMDGICGAACSMTDWKLQKNPLFKYGEGYLSTNSSARAKWNVMGEEFDLYGPKHPTWGKARLLLDDQIIDVIDFSSLKPQPSSILRHFSAPNGHHAVILEVIDGIIALDSLTCIQRIDIE
jgi:hypothetical protein